MALTPGTRLGPYEVTAPIGAGGMGEVYRATDTKLRRDVAIKVLPETFAQDRERLARFEREAHLLASLNHPNIASIYGLEESEGASCLVLELVEGETLAERIAAGPMRLEEALRIARQIAEALEAAHESGIIHRDLKPANVKVKPDDTVKVLDFGLAKAFGDDTAESSSDSSLSPTMTLGATRAGVILGTAAYMSPEQARGKEINKRTDIWAFGCVLYELLTGQKAFPGETVSDTIARILEREPDWEKLPAGTPARIQDLLRRCIRRGHRDRLHDIADARIEIAEVLEGQPGPEPMAAPTSGRSGVLVWTAVALIVGLAAGLGLSRLGGHALETAPATPQVRFQFPHLTESARINWLQVSPNGRYVVYQPGAETEGGIYLRDLSSLEVRALPGAANGDSPFFSPDSRWVGFFAGGKLWKTAVSGGLPVEICDVGPSPGGGWGPDNLILYSPTWASELYAVNADGGEPRPVSTLDTAQGETGHWWPRFLPQGRHVLFTAYGFKGSLAQARIGLLDLETGTHRYLGRGAAAHYSSSGHLIYHRAGVYEASTFDLDSFEIVGSPRVVLDQVPALDPAGSRENYFSFSEDGVLAYSDRRSGGTFVESSLYWLDRSGELERLPFPPMVYGSLSLSPDGERIVVAAISNGEFTIRLLDIERGTFENLNFESNSLRPRWHPDGGRFAFVSSRSGPWNVYWRDQSTGQPETALIVSEKDEAPGDFTPDGKKLLFNRWAKETGLDVWLLDLESQEQRPLVTHRSYDEHPRVSPEGNWLAYESDRSEVREVYVQPLNGSGPAVRVSRQGGRNVVWSRTGEEIFYIADGHAMVATYRTSSGTFDADPPTLFARKESDAQRRTVLFLEPGSDGQRLLVVLPEQEPQARITVVTNGFVELRGR